MNSDPSGHSIIGALIAAFVLLFTPVGGVLFQAATSLVAYAGFAVASLFDKQIRKDMNAIGWNPFNTSESLVLKSQSVSFYRGRPVFRVAKNAGFSFGALFLGRNANETKFDFVRHEYGHTKQLIGQGPLGYLIKTVIPSVTGYIVDGMGLLAKMNIVYEGLPWEDDANIYGGAERYQKRHNITYWDFLLLMYN